MMASTTTGMWSPGGRPQTGLTPVQARLLTYIGDYSRSRDGAPSYEEMAGALGLQSKSGIHRLVTALDERGYIVRYPDRARSITLTVSGARIAYSSLADNITDQILAAFKAAKTPLTRQALRAAVLKGLAS